MRLTLQSIAAAKGGREIPEAPIGPLRGGVQRDEAQAGQNSVPWGFQGSSSAERCGKTPSSQSCWSSSPGVQISRMPITPYSGRCPSSFDHQLKIVRVMLMNSQAVTMTRCGKYPRARHNPINSSVVPAQERTCRRTWGCRPQSAHDVRSRSVILARPCTDAGPFLVAYEIRGKTVQSTKKEDAVGLSIQESVELIRGQIAKGHQLLSHSEVSQGNEAGWTGTAQHTLRRVYGDDSPCLAAFKRAAPRPKLAELTDKVQMGATSARRRPGENKGSEVA